jgi:aminodeoxyfutalosine synthase
MQTIIDKYYAGERLSYEEGVKLYDLDVFTLGKMADWQKQKRYGKKVFFNINRHINPTNICKDICKFCGFSANRKNPNPYAMSPSEVVSIVDGAVERGAKEVHIVSAHNPDVGYEWYFEMFTHIKKRYPDIHIKSLTAAEIHFLADEYHKSYDEVLQKMIDSGVDSIPGGGAEIFDEEVRDFICKGKVTSAQWLEIHELWHKKGRMSNATMLFGHVEKPEHRVDHMIRLRDVQDRTGGFNAFIPLVYQRENNYLKVEKFPAGEEILKTIAISRIMLDNIPHIKAYWVTSTINLAMLACEFGADDLDGTIEKESISSASGAKSAHGTNMDTLIELAQTSGFIPVERDSLYNELKVYN